MRVYNDFYWIFYINLINLYKVYRLSIYIGTTLLYPMEQVKCDECGKKFEGFTLNQAEHNLAVHKMSKHKNTGTTLVPKKEGEKDDTN